MYKRPSPGTLSKRNHRLLHTLSVIGFVCLSIFTTVASTTTIYAAGPGGNVADPVVRFVDIAEPAVIRIFTTIGGHLTVHFSATNSVTFPQGNSTAYPLELSGSGTFITAHGDILTADHVINPPHDQALDQFLDDTAASDVAAYINQNAKSSSSQVSPTQVDQELKSGQLPADTHYDPATSQVILSTSYTGPLTAPDLQSLPDQVHASVDRIEMESSFNDKDVAIVHVSMLNNDTPSVQLGDSSDVQQQDHLTIIGFPGNADVSNKPTDLLTSSVNDIIVSSTKTTDSGAQVIQVAGNVEHGDSGGPALDSTGTVVGIVSFGLSSSGGTSFLQASNSARAQVQSLHLDTTPGPFQSAWSQAFADYAATTPGHWHKAQREFQKLATNYPLFKAVTPYLAYVQAQAKSEPITKPSTPTSSPTQNTFMAYVWTIVSIAVIILLIVLLFGVVMLRRRGKKKAPAPSMAQPSQRPLSSAVASQEPEPSDAVRQRLQTSPYDDSMTAFGAPPAALPATRLSQAPSSVVSGTLRPWPCGHMNRSNARYCSICGEPAPPPPTSRRVEQ